MADSQPQVAADSFPVPTEHEKEGSLGHLLTPFRYEKLKCVGTLMLCELLWRNKFVCCICKYPYCTSIIYVNKSHQLFLKL